MSRSSNFIARARSNKALRANFATALTTVAIVLFSLLPRSVAAQSRTVQFKIENASDYGILAIYASPTDTHSWRRDFLGDGTLPTGFEFTSQSVWPGYYDLKLIDEDRDVCIVRNVDLTSSQSWKVTTPWLLNCEIDTR